MATTQSEAPEGPDTSTGAAVVAAGLGVALTIGAIAVFGPHAALSVGLGAAIAVVNLVTMRAIIRALLKAPAVDADAETDPKAEVDHVAEGKRGGAAWGAFAVVKILVLFGGIWLLLTRGIVDPMPLVVGYGVLPMGIAASGLFGSLAPKGDRLRRKK